MAKFEDLTGQTFGSLTVIEHVGFNKHGGALWLCRCTCGKEVVVAASELKSKHVTSCGCHRRKITSQRFKTHGMSYTKIYRTWRGMMDRCYNPKNKRHDAYGGRGIKVCERWHDINNFYEDVSKLENFGKPGYTLNRIRVNEDYKPDNVRWATPKQQSNNKRNNIKVNYQDEEMTLTEAAEKSGINYGTLRDRYKRGDRGERLFRPVEK